MKRLDFSHALSSCVAAAVAVLAGCGGSQPPIGATGATRNAPDSYSHHKTYLYVGHRQTFQVPAGVTRLQVVAIGGVGSGHGGVGPDYGGGNPGRVYAVISVAPAERLYVYVGGNGDYVYGYGGYNGGASGGSSGGSFTAYSSGYGGGGATDIREGGTRLKNRILVAGGGGGEGGLEGHKRYGKGGKGGGMTAGSGWHGHGVGLGGYGGGGGSQESGGGGGRGDPSGTGPDPDGANGRLGKGGQGGYDTGYNGGAGGGGGGGFYGGGGGGTGGELYYSHGFYGGGGGGGGGSSYVESSAVKYRTWLGWEAPNGLVVFSW